MWKRGGGLRGMTTRPDDERYLKKRTQDEIAAVIVVSLNSVN